MVSVAGRESSFRALVKSVRRVVVTAALAVVGVVVVYNMFTARVRPNQWGVEQRRFGFKTGIGDAVYGPGLYFVGPGTTMHNFPRELHVLEASNDRDESKRKAQGGGQDAVDRYFDDRSQTLGPETHRIIDAFNVQTSDGYAVTGDVTLLYAIEDAVKIAREFGWGSLYVDSFVINTFRNGVLTTLGKMNAESFYNEEVRIAAVHEAEEFLRKRFAERGFRVDSLLLRNYAYAPNYERSLHDKKVAVQLTEKNRKESVVNEGRAKLSQIESKGNATITIAESEINAQIAKVRAEAQLYAAQRRAQADQEVNVAGAESKRLKADAVTRAGGRYVVALETARMFDNIDGAVMTPEQYIAFIRNAWSVIGVSPNAAGVTGEGR